MKVSEIFEGTLNSSRALCVSVGVLLVALHSAGQELRPQDRVVSALESELKTSNAYASTISELAVERYISNTTRGLNWIMGVQNGLEAQRFTDGNVTIVLLSDSACADGLRLFVRSYNHMVLRGADHAFMESRFTEAEHTYKLLQKFAPEEEFELKQRLGLCERGKRDGGSDRIRDDLKKLGENYDLFAFNRGMETNRAVVVTNLLTFSLRDYQAKVLSERESESTHAAAKTPGSPETKAQKEKRHRVAKQN